MKIVIETTADGVDTIYASEDIEVVVVDYEAEEGDCMMVPQLDVRPDDKLYPPEMSARVFHQPVVVNPEWVEKLSALAQKG